MPYILYIFHREHIHGADSHSLIQMIFHYNICSTIVQCFRILNTQHPNVILLKQITDTFTYLSVTPVRVQQRVCMHHVYKMRDQCMPYESLNK